MFPVNKGVEQLKMNHLLNIHDAAPAYLKVDISLNDNASHQTRLITTFSCQTPRVNSFGLKPFLTQQLNAGTVNCLFFCVILAHYNYISHHHNQE